MLHGVIDRRRDVLLIKFIGVDDEALGGRAVYRQLPVLEEPYHLPVAAWRAVPLERLAAGLWLARRRRAVARLVLGGASLSRRGGRKPVTVAECVEQRIDDCGEPVATAVAEQHSAGFRGHAGASRHHLVRARRVLATEVAAPDLSHDGTIAPSNKNLSDGHRTSFKRCRVGLATVFDEIMEKFADSPSQQAVIRLLLERGFSVNEEGRVVSGGIEIPDTGIAREVGVDRRVVDATTDAILADNELRPIFENISSIPSLMDLAPVLDLTVLTVTVIDETQPGIVADITTRIADHGVTIRQIVSEDPEFTQSPKLYVVVDEELPGELINEIRGVDFVRKIQLE